MANQNFQSSLQFSSPKSVDVKLSTSLQLQHSNSLMPVSKPALVNYLLAQSVHVLQILSLFSFNVCHLCFSHNAFCSLFDMFHQ